MTEILIPLTQGKYAIIDDGDYPLISQYKWYAGKDGNVWYAKSYNKGSKNKLRLHRLILNAKRGEEIDHINGDGLDNRRCNIRIVTRQQNMCNRKKLPNTQSKYRGVGYDCKRKKWYSQITINKKHYNLGRFPSEREAAKAYDERAKLAFGDFAKLNLPE